MFLLYLRPNGGMFGLEIEMEVSGGLGACRSIVQSHSHQLMEPGVSIKIGTVLILVSRHLCGQILSDP